MARKQEFDWRKCFLKKLLFPFGIFFDANNVAKLVVGNALGEEIIATGFLYFTVFCQPVNY